MPKYTTNEFSFTLPESLHDRSLHIFALSEQGPSEMSIVIARAAVPASATLPGQMATLLGELGKQLPGFRVLDQTERTLPGNLRAGELRYAHQQGGTLLNQRLVGMLLPAKSGEGQTWVSITATFGPKANAAWHDSFEAMLASLAVA